MFKYAKDPKAVNLEEWKVMGLLIEFKHFPGQFEFRKPGALGASSLATCSLLITPDLEAESHV